MGTTEDSGCFSLTTPTGSGKTLMSAAFALNHACANAFTRVIYVIPYTSIIEQNARVFSEILGEQNVLEHHSLASWRSSDDDESADERATHFRLASENWDAPFIVTTNVQFFESLHSHRPSAVRKLHRIMDAVIIFDECQTFPPRLLDLTLDTLQGLLRFGKTSLVFCTATQPALEKRASFPKGFEKMKPLIPRDWELAARPEFSRTFIRFSDESETIDSLARRVCKDKRVLIIVNTTRTARELAQALAREAPEREIYHLSARMCPTHRRTILEAVNLRLRSKRCDCILIATQLVEAGVDIDFPKVLRELGPLDSILQAAGRCNREGRMTNEEGIPTHGEVEVFRLAGGKLPPDAAYKCGTALAEKYLERLVDGHIPESAVSEYFHELYRDLNRDGNDLLILRSERLYRRLGESYHWIETDEPSRPVLCDYGEIGAAWIAILKAQGPIPLDRQQHRAIAEYCVNLRESEVAKAVREKSLTELPNGQIIANTSYHNRFGLITSTTHDTDATKIL